jgi:hypothetical protein
MLTPIFGRVKGETEQSLFDFHKANPNLKVYNVRPGGVDWRDHPEIHPFMPHQAMYKRVLLPVFGAVKSMMTPTRPLGKVLTELAMSKGAPLEGKDIQMGGRLVPNVAIRRMAGL